MRKKQINRRGLLLSGLIAAPLLGSASEAQEAKKSDAPAPTGTTFVLVHGAWGGGWAFRKVESLLRAKGHTVYRPSLTGQGERAHLASPDIGLSTHIQDVVNVLLFEELHDVVLMGHSYGGMVVTGVADKIPERIRRMIYVDAFVPSDGESLVSISGGSGDRMKQGAKDGFLVPAWVSANQSPPKDVPQSLKTFTDPIVLKNEAAKRLPTTYILTVDAGKDAKDDGFWAQSERAKKRGWPVLQLTADHNPQWSAPEAFAELLDKNKGK